MNLDEFIKIVSSELAEFKADWEAQRRELPDQFPDEMGEGDWFEQFLFFIEHRGKDTDGLSRR